LIFTLGVLGWGFFAIDRLIDKNQQENFHNLNINQKIKKKTNQEWSIRKKIADWLINNQGSSHKKKKIAKIVKIQQEDKKIVTDYNNKAHLYFYLIDANENLHLKKYKIKLTEKLNSEEILSIIIKKIISGHSIKNNNIIDSFPIKPRLLSASIKNNVAELNFNDDFGKGVSFQTLKYQIKQILKTASGIQDINSIRILINNKRVNHIGGDGLILPSLITNKNITLLY